MFEVSPGIIALMAFAAVSCFAFAAGQYFVSEARLNRRIAGQEREQDTRFSDSFNRLVVRYFDEKRFKVEGAFRSKLRQQLLRAGFFHPNAINYYIFARVGAVIALPVFTYALVILFMPSSGALLKSLLIGV